MLHTDRIQPTRFSQWPSLLDEIEGLTVEQASQSNLDPNLDFLLAEIEAVEENRDREEFSLNLAGRQAELEAAEAEQLARENERRAALELPPIEGLDELDAESTASAAEILLNQATRLAARMVEEREPRAIISGVEQPSAAPAPQ